MSFVWISALADSALPGGFGSGSGRLPYRQSSGDRPGIDQQQQ